jgi:hypothetical protein
MTFTLLVPLAVRSFSDLFGYAPLGAAPRGIRPHKGHQLLADHNRQHGDRRAPSGLTPTALSLRSTTPSACT